MLPKLISTRQYHQPTHWHSHFDSERALTFYECAVRLPAEILADAQRQPSSRGVVPVSRANIPPPTRPSSLILSTMGHFQTIIAGQLHLHVMPR